MNIATFRTEFPEFDSADDTLVTALLARAEVSVDAETYGDRYDHAHGLLAAHLLACAPGGLMARLEADKYETTYGRAFVGLREAATTMIRVF